MPIMSAYKPLTGTVNDPRAQENRCRKLPSWVNTATD